MALVLEVPYTVTPPEVWREKVNKARKDSTKHQAELFLFAAEKLQRWLNNGFVVFKPEYPRLVECLIRESIEQGQQGIVDWQKVLVQLKAQLGDGGEEDDPKEAL